jgi:hyperosmotically inducible periplasmic protein
MTLKHMVFSVLLLAAPVSVSAKEVTADQAGNSKADVQLAAKIRRAIVADRSLSIDAHNIKIIANDGVVILKGPVKSTAEKQTVEQKAADLAGGSSKIQSEIQVTD